MNQVYYVILAVFGLVLFVLFPRQFEEHHGFEEEMGIGVGILVFWFIAWYLPNRRVSAQS